MMCDLLGRLIPLAALSIVCATILGCFLIRGLLKK